MKSGVSGKPAAPIVMVYEYLSWWWNQQGPLMCQYICTRMHSTILRFRSSGMWCQVRWVVATSNDSSIFMFRVKQSTESCHHTPEVGALNIVRVLNTLPSGHVETRDCSPTCCWRVTSFYVFLRDILHMHLSAGLAHFSLQGYRQLDAGSLGLKLQTDCSWPPIVRTIRLQQRDHSFRYSLCFPSVAIMALHKNVLQEDYI